MESDIMKTFSDFHKTLRSMVDTTNSAIIHLKAESTLPKPY